MAPNIAGTPRDQDWNLAHAPGSLPVPDAPAKVAGKPISAIRPAKLRQYRVKRMAITISSSFDAGNIRVVRQDGDTAELEIAQDHLSDFYQWF